MGGMTRLTCAGGWLKSQLGWKNAGQRYIYQCLTIPTLLLSVCVRKSTMSAGYLSRLPDRYYELTLTTLRHLLLCLIRICANEPSLDYCLNMSFL